MDILRINTAGSVDDGKSTLIGRLMYDNHALTIEQEALIHKKTQEKGLTDLDFSVITDGLIAEREQGITIDVAHIYFSTNKRKFIIADSPGHIEYTRNMVTGASMSDVSVILIDARKGLLEQTYRHYFISHLLRMQHVIFCVNKMDLINYGEKEFNIIAEKIKEMIKTFSDLEQDISIVPISSLKGDNVVKESDKMPWYKGETLSDILHNVNIKKHDNYPFFMDIQNVFHVQNQEFVDYRAYAGRIINGIVSIGDTITILPSLKQSKVKEIRQFNSCLEKAEQGQSVQISLEDDIDISRGMALLGGEVKPVLMEQTLNADIVWLNEKSATLGGKYIIQTGARTTICKLQNIFAIIPPEKPQEQVQANEVKLNEISKVNIKLASPIFLDYYADNKNNGAFILIDQQSNNTAAVGFVTR